MFVWEFWSIVFFYIFFVSQYMPIYRNCLGSASRQLSAKQTELECGPMPNVMVALSNIGGALCSMPQFG